MKVGIIGTGYVGLVTALVFSSKNVPVICADIDREKIRLLNKKQLPIYEIGLAELLSESCSKRIFAATTNIKKTVLDSDLIFICVGTPNKKNGSVDLRYVKKAAVQIGKAISESNEYKVIIIKSTVPPETTRKIVLPIIEKKSGKKVGYGFGVAFNPEFLRQGQAVKDSLNPDRIVIGTENDKDRKILADFYSIINPNAAVMCTNLTTAETIKYASNSFFALLISYANEWADLCENIGDKVDITTVLSGVMLDKRISPVIDGKKIQLNINEFIWPGCGFGGSCLAKDLKAIKSYNKNQKMPLVENTIKVNDLRASHIVSLVENKLGNLKGKRIAILGLAFKSNTGDTRESPAIKIINILEKKQAIISAHDPIALENARKELDKSVRLSSNIENVLKDAEACIITTGWLQYKNIPEASFKALMKRSVVVDCPRILKPENYATIEYTGTGLSMVAR